MMTLKHPLMMSLLLSIMYPLSAAETTLPKTVMLPISNAQSKALPASNTQNKVISTSTPINKVMPASSVQQATPAPSKIATPATTAMPKLGTAAPEVRVLLTPDRETTLASTVPARIIKLNASLGKSFKEGDVLVAFDCQESYAKIEMAKAELASAIDQHEAKVKMQGLQQASDVEVSVAASTVNKNKAQLNMQQSQASQCSIRAPWSGRVAKVHVRSFMTVSPAQPLMDLVKDGPLRMRANFPSKMLKKIKVGTPFNILIDETGEKYEAKVHAISGRVDPISQTVDIEAVLSKHYSDLLPGMSGVADLSPFNP